MTDRCPGCQSDKREERRVVTYLGEDVPHECEHYWHDGSVEEAGASSSQNRQRTDQAAACGEPARQPSERSTQDPTRYVEARRDSARFDAHGNRRW